MKENQDKSHFLSRIDKNSRIKLPNGVVNRSEQKKLPDIIIDTKLIFFIMHPIFATKFVGTCMHQQKVFPIFCSVNVKRL